MNSTTRENKQATVQGQAGKIFLDDGGDGNIPVLFVHSFGGSSAHWQYQLPSLRKNRRAIAMDLRGHGQSDAPGDNDYAVPTLAADIAAVADQLELERFILVGHSMGGSAAIAYAGAHPDRVAGLFITGTPGKTPADQSKPIIASLESEKYDTVMMQYMKQLLKNATPLTEQLEMTGMKKIPREASMAIIKSVFAYDPIPDLQKYPGPKMILSTSSEEQANSLHQVFPAIPYKTVGGTSHWIQLDKPDAFNDMLAAFINQADPVKK